MFRVTYFLEKYQTAIGVIYLRWTTLLGRMSRFCKFHQSKITLKLFLNIYILNMVCFRTQGPNTCGIVNHDYDLLSSMTFADAWIYSKSQQSPTTVPCLSQTNNKMDYSTKGTSIVTEVGHDNTKEIYNIKCSL